MSRTDVAAEECVGLGAAGSALEAYANREVNLGALKVTRALPIKDRRMVGPWCFLDRFGPLEFANTKPMDVAPHPHTGLQTVTWLFDGEVLHKDSLDSEVMAVPGGVSVMTAGSGISHTEETPEEHSGRINGVQLWVAQTDQTRNLDPRFQHVREVPTIEAQGGLVQVLSGELAESKSQAWHDSPIVGADLQIWPDSELELPLEAEYEHAILIVDGQCELEGQPLVPGQLYYLGTCRHSVALRSKSGARTLLIGGEPFKESILMWWNFVGRTPEEIAEFRADWEAEERFGQVTRYRGPRLAAPELIKLARPNPMS